MGGVIAVAAQCPIGLAVEEVSLLIKCLRDHEWPDHVYFVPLSS